MVGWSTKNNLDFEIAGKNWSKRVLGRLLERKTFPRTVKDNRFWGQKLPVASFTLNFLICWLGNFRQKKSKSGWSSERVSTVTSSVQRSVLDFSSATRQMSDNFFLRWTTTLKVASIEFWDYNRSLFIFYPAKIRTQKNQKVKRLPELVLIKRR